MKILIVRLGALGDLVHALPVAAALRDRFPAARIDWIVDGRYEGLLRLVRGLDRVLVIRARPPAVAASLRRVEAPPPGPAPASDDVVEVPRALPSPASVGAVADVGTSGPGARRPEAPSGAPAAEGGSPGDSGKDRSIPAFERFAGRRGLVAAIRALRATRYDVAIDLQGLVKSAVIARLSGARRVVGFARGHVREAAAGFFYGQRVTPRSGGHVVRKNLAMLGAFGMADAPLRFPLVDVAGAVVDTIRCDLGLDRAGAFAALVPGAGWPNKCWPPERFGQVAAALRDGRGLRSAVIWGPGERDLAERVAQASAGAVVVAPATTLADLVAVGRAARLVVAGDSGPMHLAAAAGAPTVALLGPTDPARNGPWHPDDEAVSRYDRCECHYRRRCTRSSRCIDDITVEEVVAAAERRLDRR